MGKNLKCQAIYLPGVGGVDPRELAALEFSKLSMLELELGLLEKGNQSTEGIIKL